MPADSPLAEPQADAPGAKQRVLEQPGLVDEDFDWNIDVVTNLLALYMTFFACTWGLIALSVSLTYIDSAFPDQTAQSSWIAAVIGLAQCVLSLFIGEISDIFGRRYFMIVGNLLLLAGGLLGSRAPSVRVIIGGQVLTGMGISMGYLATPLLAELVPKRSRAVVISIGTALLGIEASWGAVGIGAFEKYNVGGIHQGWRPPAYITAGLGFLALVLVFIFYHPDHRPNPEGLSNKQKLASMDWFGIFIGTAGLTLLLLGLQFGGNPKPWASARVLGLLVVGATCLVVFIVWEAKFVSFGLFPKAVFAHRNYAIALATQFVEGMAVNTGVAFLVQIQFLLFTNDPVMTQVRNIPYGTSTLFGSAIAGAILYYTKETKWVMISSMALGLLGVGMMSLIKPASSYALWFFATIFVGISTAGMGISVSVIASLCTPNHLIATSLSILQSIRGLGGAVGIVIFSQVFGHKSARLVPEYVATATIGAGLPPLSVTALLKAIFSGDPSAVAAVPGVTQAVIAAVQPALRQGYAHSFAWMWYSMLPFVAVAFIGTCWLKPTKGMTTEEVAVHVQERFSHNYEARSGDREEKGVSTERVERAKN